MARWCGRGRPRLFTHPLRRAVLAAVAFLAVIAPGTADGATAAGPGRGGAARSDGATAVIGGGGFADAPLLAPGVYVDTLLPRETLFYAVALRAGERLRIRATIDISVSSRSVQDIPDALGFTWVHVYTPLRQSVPSGDLTMGGQDDDYESTVETVEGPRLVSEAAAGRRAAENKYWNGPGIYHVAIVISELGSSLGATVELPLRLVIEDSGRPEAGSPARPSPGPLGDPRRGPEVVAAAGRATVSTRGRPVRAAPLAAAAVGGLLVGAAGGYGAAARRRRYRDRAAAGTEP
jgi:hypothetical protein